MLKTIKTNNREMYSVSDKETKGKNKEYVWNAYSIKERGQIGK